LAQPIVTRRLIHSKTVDARRYPKETWLDARDKRPRSKGCLFIPKLWNKPLIPQMRTVPFVDFAAWCIWPDRLGDVFHVFDNLWDPRDTTTILILGIRIRIFRRGASLNSL
jgi:hypothetical protein